MFQHPVQIAVHRDSVVANESHDSLDLLVKLRTDTNGLAMESRGLDRLQEEVLVVGDFSR